MAYFLTQLEKIVAEFVSTVLNAQRVNCPAAGVQQGSRQAACQTSDPGSLSRRVRDSRGVTAGSEGKAGAGRGRPQPGLMSGGELPPQAWAACPPRHLRALLPVRSPARATAAQRGVLPAPGSSGARFQRPPQRWHCPAAGTAVRESVASSSRREALGPPHIPH